MNKKLFLLGVVTIGLLLFGSFPAVAPDDSGPFSQFSNGEVDLSFDLSLTHVGSQSSSTPSGLLTNTNLRYNLTSMKSPLDQFFNVGAFMFGDPNTGPMPEFMINGTFEGSELFVKIVNDQYSVTDPSKRLLDWQATLTLQDAIDIEVLIPSTADLGGFPIDLLPTTASIPAGSGIPPLPVIQSTTSFSDFEDLGNLAHSYGYDGLPFVSPSIFYIENVSTAYDYWNTVDLDQMFGTAEDPNNNRTLVLNTSNNTGGFGLSFDAAFFNTTADADFGNVSLNAHWNTSGWLDNFDVSLFADLNQNTELDAEEEFSLVFDLIGTDQADLPINVGDSGDYVMGMNFDASVNLDDVTDNNTANAWLDEISASINELDGEPLLTYTVDAMDGLYYHINGYLFDLPSFMNDRVGYLFNENMTQNPLPIDDYYMSINDMDGGKSNFALNLFDAGVYRNDSMFYEIYDGYSYVSGTIQDPTTGEWHEIWDRQPFQAQDENTTIIYQHMPGITNAKIYSELDWNMYWNHGLTIEENIDYLQSYEINGDVQYVEDTNIIQIVANDSFQMSTNYVAVLEIVPPMQLNGFNSYQSMTSPYMMMFENNDDSSEPTSTVGFGAQNGDSQQENSLLNPQSLLPLPARTPDWEQVGGPIVFLEGYVMQVADVITDPDFISYIEEMVASQGLGNDLDIHGIEVDLDWMVNETHAGATSWVYLDMTMVNSDTTNMKFVTLDAVVDSYESYLWSVDGIFDSATVSVQMNVDVSSPDEPTTITVPPETTTTETTLELTPGFEVIFTLGSLIALPLFFKKRR